MISTGTAVAAPVYQMFDIPDECPAAVNCTYSPRPSSSLPPRSLVSEDFNLKKNDEPDYDGFMKSRQAFSPNAERAMELALSFVQQNNPCDETGTLYLAKFMAYFWPETFEYKALDTRYQGGIELLFKIANKGTFTTEGKTVPHYVLPQAKCIAEILRNQKKF